MVWRIEEPAEPETPSWYGSGAGRAGRGRADAPGASSAGEPAIRDDALGLAPRDPWPGGWEDPGEYPPPGGAEAPSGGPRAADEGAPIGSRSSVLEAAVLVLLALLLALTVKTYVAEAYEIKGRSMKPTFENGDRVVVLKLFYGIARGDIIIFESVDDPGKDLIKRVIGLPGERIRIAKGRVTIDGREIEEEYLGSDRPGRYSEPIEEVVGADEYYVLGDNRDDSHDSRRFHGVPGASIKGKVVARWWPFHEVRAF